VVAMTSDLQPAPTGRTIVLGPDEGRSYPCGDMRAVFKSDGDETDRTYSISEWILEPGCQGPGSHRHEANDDVFFVLEGSVTFVLDGRVHVAAPGAFVRVPPGVEHGFANDGDVPARFLNIYVPGGFEDDMPSIVEWFAQHPTPAAHPS